MLMIFVLVMDSASIREKVLSNVRSLKTTETYGLPLKIDLKVDAKYMMTVNLGY